MMGCLPLIFKCQPYKMVEHTQKICQQQLINSLIVFDHFVGLACKDLIQKYSVTYINGLTFDVKEGLPYAWDLSLKNRRFLLMFSTGFTSPSVLLLFPLLITFFIFMHGF